MMECWLTGYNGSKISLPQVLTWKFCYGMGTPCDSFQIECLWNQTVAVGLGDAVGFGAVREGETLFTGVVDEYETMWDAKGGRLRLHGRGMAALLLDNEAVGSEYQMATLADILRYHVTPYGIQTVGGGGLSAVPGFSVATGSSEWAVVYQFARYYGGLEPRFDRAGRLLLDRVDSGVRRIITQQTPVLSATLTEKRYGVLSEVLVRDRTGRGERRVVNSVFAQRGGRSRKVLTLPRKSSFETMRYSGQYQLERSAEEQKTLTLRAAQLCLAWPGELLELQLEQPQISGLWRVRETETGVEETGTYTTLVLAEEGGS